MKTTIIDDTLPAAHPCFPGHFAGQPVAPAVVVLDAVIRALGRAEPGLRARGASSAKFPAPLLPEQPFRITLEVTSEHAVRFDCHDPNDPQRRFAHGTLRVEPLMPTGGGST